MILLSDDNESPDSILREYEEIYRLTPTGDLTAISGTGTQVIYGSLGPYVPATDGNLYFVLRGMTGSDLYRRTPDGTLSIVHEIYDGSWSFQGTSNLMQGLDGALYGIDNGSGVRVLFRLALDGTYTPLHTFVDATSPQERFPEYLLAGADGNLYGEVASSIFRATPTGVVTTLHTFDASAGDPPLSDVVQAADGSFLGVVFGAGGDRLVRVASDGTVSTVHTFTEHEHVSLAAGPTGVYGAFPRSDSRPGGAVFVVANGTYRIVQEFAPPPPPTITAGPGNTVRTVEGQTRQIFAGATSMSALTVQWQVSVDNGATFTDIPGATAFVYTFVATPAQNGARYRAVFTNAGGTSATSSVTVIVRRAGARPVASDLDGDAQADLVLWENDIPDIFGVGGIWVTMSSSSGYSPSVRTVAFWGSGALGDVPFLADMDGDGLADYVVWRPSTGTWYWLTSSTGYNDANAQAIQWGALGDVPLLADLDGDGRADLIVWRPSSGLWFWLTSGSDYDYRQQHEFQWGSGASGDVPLIADLDGDGIGDLVVWRPATGTWYWVTSSTGYSLGTQRARQWGSSANADVPLLADIDGDGRADLVIWRPATGTWFWLPSAAGYDYGAARSVQWGNGALGDVPLLPDLDGDGRADLTVWRASTGTWYWLPSSSGYAYTAAQSRVWGATPHVRDIPVSR